MIITNFKKRFRWQATAGDKFLRVGKRDHVVLAGMEDGCLQNRNAYEKLIKAMRVTNQPRHQHS